MRKMTENGALLRQMIKKNAATPEGFSIADGEAAGLANGPKVAHKLVKDGIIFKAKVSHWLIRYFLTAEAAQAFMMLHQADAVVAAAKTTSRIAAPIKLCKAAQIVYPENYIFTSCPAWPDRFQATEALPWQHGGMRAMS